MPYEIQLTIETADEHLSTVTCAETLNEDIKRLRRKAKKKPLFIMLTATNGKNFLKTGLQITHHESHQTP